MFRDTMVEKFGEDAVKEIEKTIRILLWDACTIWTTNSGREPAAVVNNKVLPSCNDPDFAEAYGIMRGVSLALNYTRHSAGTWFDEIYDELKERAFEQGYISV